MNRRPPRYGEIVEKQENVLLVDGNAVFKWGFFGAKNQYNEHGHHIGGLYSFLTLLRKMLTDDMYHKVYVFWDGNFSGKLRYEIYEPYKSSRGKNYQTGTQPVDESELLQRELIWDYLNEMHIRQIKHDIVESDDFIAYYCLNKKPNEKITIVSGDRDFLQLITEDIRIYFLDLKEYIDILNYSSYFCYSYQNAMLVKMMTGDTSDTIKGIKGLGEPTLVSTFPELKDRPVTLNEVITSAKELQEARIKKKLKPLKVLTNIIESVTDGVQKENIYEINERLVNLRKPMLTPDSIIQFEDLINTNLHEGDRELKRVWSLMKRDGLDKAIGEYRYPEFLVPFKKLISR